MPGVVWRIQTYTIKSISAHRKKLKYATIVSLILLYIVYFVSALLHDVEKAETVYILTIVVCVYNVYAFIWDYFGHTIISIIEIHRLALKTIWIRFRW